MISRNEIKGSFDEYKMLDKKVNVDGGDSCQRMGMYWALSEIMSLEDRKKYPNLDIENRVYVFKVLQPHPGIIIRHPWLFLWSSDWDRGSTDQTRAYLVGAGLVQPEQVKRYFKGHLKRALLTCNNRRRNRVTKENHGEYIETDKKGRKIYKDYSLKLIGDPTFIEFWSLYIRGLKLWPLYPFLLIFDIQNLGTATLNRLNPKKDDIINQALITLYNRHRYWSPWAWLANKIHPEEIVLEKVKSYFRDRRAEGDNLRFFVEMFKDAYRNLK